MPGDTSQAYRTGQAPASNFQSMLKSDAESLSVLNQSP